MCSMDKDTKSFSLMGMDACFERVELIGVRAVNIAHHLNNRFMECVFLK